MNYSKIFSYATTEELGKLYEKISRNHEVKLVKNPQKTLTMIKVRETTGNSLFYLGEAICTECMVSVDEVRGFSVLLGDDFEKAISVASIDAVLHSEYAEKEEIIACLEKIEQRKAEEKSYINAEINKSKVDFNLMGE